jgi:hypothetical protein
MSRTGSRASSRLGASPVRKTQASAAVADYARQRLVDLMRNRGSQFPHHAHAVDVREICFEFALSLPLCFGPLAIFDVRKNSVPLDNLSLLIAQRHTTSQNPAIFPIRSGTKAGLPVERFAISKGGAPLVQKRLTILGMNGSLQPEPVVSSADKPVYSAQRLFTNSLDPSGRAVHAIAGIDSITS